MKISPLHTTPYILRKLINPTLERKSISSITDTIANCIMISLAVILPHILCIRYPIRLRIISASKHAVNAIFVKNICVEEVAEPCLAMAQRICVRGIACCSTDAGIVRLGLRECLYTHVAVVSIGRLDGCVAEVHWATVVGDCHRGLIINIGAANDDVKFSLILTHVGGFTGGHHGAEEGTFNASERWRCWAINIVSVLGWIALEI